MAALGDLYEIVLAGRLHNQEIRNVFHYELTAITGAGGAPDADAAQAASAAGESLWNLIRVNTSNEASCYGILAQRVLPTPRTAGHARTPATILGAIAGSSLPSAVAVIIKKKTQYVGKSYRGRTYFAGIPVVQELDSVITTPAFDAWTVVATGMNQVLTGASINGRQYGWTPKVWSKKQGVRTTITSCVVDQVLRTQRRRQVGKGV